MEVGVGITGHFEIKENYDKSIIHLPRQEITCLSQIPENMVIIERKKHII